MAPRIKIDNKFTYFGADFWNMCDVSIWFYIFKKPQIRSKVIVCFQELQAELEVQQEHVNGLQNMVVVVDDASSDTGQCFNIHTFDIY